MKRFSLSVLLAILCGFPVCAPAQDLQSALRDLWLNKTISLRVPDSSREMRFDAEGKRTTSPNPGEWYSDTDLHVTGISVVGEQLDITANRMDIVFDYQGGTFSDVMSDRTVHIIISLPPNATDFSRVLPALNRVFLTSKESPTDFAPEHWQSCLKHLRQEQGVWTCSDPGKPKVDSMVDPATGETIYLNPDAKGLKPPRIKKATHARYTRLAKQIRWEGSVFLQAIIDKDGKPTHIRIIRPLGYALEEEAVKAVKKWSFVPATKDGKPVAMQIPIEMAFQYSPEY